MRTTAAHHPVARALGAVLSLAVVWIHVVDQGGLPGDKTPSYVGIGYWALELTGLVLAAVLLAGPGRHTLKAWAVAAAVAVGPLAGYVLSRGPGLPDYTDDRGNWTEPIGLWSLAVEGTLLVLSAALVARSRPAVARS